MVQRIKHGDVRIITREGEIKIVLELNINISTDGVSASISNKEDKEEWVVPDFNSTEKIPFGKEAK